VPEADQSARLPATIPGLFWINSLQALQGKITDTYCQPLGLAMENHCNLLLTAFGVQCRSIAGVIDTWYSPWGLQMRTTGADRLQGLAESHWDLPTTLRACKKSSTRPQLSFGPHATHTISSVRSGQPLA
jgi:hypothetical protein